MILNCPVQKLSAAKSNHIDHKDEIYTQYNFLIVFQ